MPRRFVYPVACAVALLVSVATYSNHFHNDFHFDDSVDAGNGPNGFC